MTRDFFHTNLELFMFAFQRYCAVTLERGLLCSAYIPSLQLAHTNASVHLSYSSFGKPNFCLRVRGRLHNRDH
jgi:hypothetical protein